MKQDNRKRNTAAKIVASFAAAAALGAGLTGCINPEENENPDVYGPPSDFMETTETTEESFDPDDNETPNVYGPPIDENFDPIDNLEPTVYGPPPDEAGDESIVD